MAVAGILTLHYLAIIYLELSWAGASRPGDGSKAFQIFGGVLTVAMCELFVGLHIVAIQYAGSRFPYRPRMSLPVGIALSAGAVGGIAYYAWELSAA